ncbi:MAG: lysophospholipid acyltransferase family protein [Chthoniobacteraceae bacterium]
MRRGGQSSMKESRHPRVTRALVRAQFLMGLGANLFLALPYLRRTHGMEHLISGQRYLFACNHVSLLDTILLGALCWRSGLCPILVLGDRSVWKTSWLKRLLSSRTSFLLERGKLSMGRVRELQAFGRAGQEFQLVVFPEGTRGDGINVAECQPGIYFVAQEARLPIVPVFFQNMEQVSTKTGRFHPIGGLRKVEVHFGEPIAPEKYLPMPRPEFLELVRRSIAGARSAMSGILNPARIELNVNGRK